MGVVLRSAALALSLAAVASGSLAEQRQECLLEPWKVVRLGARSTGVLHELLIDRGDEVAAGQAVASLNSEIEEASLALARARAASTTQIDLAQARAEFQGLSLERNQTLFDRKVISSQQLQEAEAEHRIATLQVAAAEDEKRLAELEHRRAQAVRELRSIRTPVGGIVVSTDRTEGEYVAEGDHVATIAQVDPLRAEAFLDAGMREAVDEGATVTVYPEGSENLAVEGVVDVVDRVVDARSGTVGIRVRIDNPERLALAGLRCTLALP